MTISKKIATAALAFSLVSSAGNAAEIFEIKEAAQEGGIKYTYAVYITEGGNTSSTETTYEFPKGTIIHVGRSGVEKISKEDVKTLLTPIGKTEGLTGFYLLKEDLKPE